MKWNKILALLLVVAMAMTVLVACGGKDDDDKKEDEDYPEELTEEYLLGTWEGEVNTVEPYTEYEDVELSATVTLTFKEDGEGVMDGKIDFDEDDYVAVMEKMYANEDFLDELGITEEALEFYLEEEDISLEEFILDGVDLDDLEDAMRLDFEYELDGEDLSIDEDDDDYKYVVKGYKNGVLTVEEVSDGGSVTIKLKKK